MKVIGYIRVSTEEQAREGVSLEAQEAKLRAWWTLEGNGRPLEVHRDEGLSGGRMDRPGLEAALLACDSARGGTLVVYSLSRLARSTRGTLDVADRLARAGCDLVSLSEKIDTSSAAGKMVFRMLAVLAEFERDQISERTRGAMAQLKARGAKVGRWPTVPNEVCARAAALSRRGLSLRAVGRALVEEGLRPVGGGPAWSAKVVASMLRRAG